MVNTKLVALLRTVNGQQAGEVEGHTGCPISIATTAHTETWANVGGREWGTS